MAEFLADLLAYGAPGFFQGFQAANEYRRQKALAEFNMKMKEDELQLRKAAEARMVERERQMGEFHRAQMENFAAQGEERKAHAEQRRMEGLMKPIDPQDPLVNDLSMAARARARAAAEGMGTASREPVALPEGQIGPPEASPYDKLLGQYQGAAAEIGGIAQEEVARRDRIAKQIADARTITALKPPMGRDTRATTAQGRDVANAEIIIKQLRNIEGQLAKVPTGIVPALRTSKAAQITGIGLDKEALTLKTDVEQALNAIVYRLAQTTFTDPYYRRIAAQSVDIMNGNESNLIKARRIRELMEMNREALIQGVEYSGRDTSLMRAHTPGADTGQMSVPEALSEFAGFEVK